MAAPVLLRIENPATGELVAEVRSQTRDEVAAAVARARAAQPAWGSLPFRARAKALRRLARRLMLDSELIPMLISESGKPRFEAEAFELFYTCELTRYYTGSAGRNTLADDVRQPSLISNKRARVVLHPRGVVGVIGPWNWPLLNNYADAIAPLLCGNAVVLKPSGTTPLTSLHVAKLWREEGLPTDVFQVVTGDGDAGEALVATADMIFFTGSAKVGRAIARTAGERLIPCVLELGGKSAMIVLGDADLERAARAAVWSAFAHSGQVCIRTERVLVEASVAEAFTRLCAAEIARLRQGPPSDDGDSRGEIDVGAITFPPQIEHVERQIADAVAKGARVVAGGHRRTDLPGRYFEPTLLADVTPDMDVAREETFGPLLPVLRVNGAEEALRIANDSPLGLSGSVWSRDASRAEALARRLEAGSVCVNDVLLNYLCVESPIGGIKSSGLGVRHGPEALRQFCRIETIVTDRPLLGLLSPLIARRIAFPYRLSELRFIRWMMRRIY